MKPNIFIIMTLVLLSQSVFAQELPEQQINDVQKWSVSLGVSAGGFAYKEKDPYYRDRSNTVKSTQTLYGSLNYYINEADFLMYRRAGGDDLDLFAGGTDITENAFLYGRAVPVRDQLDLYVAGGLSVVEVLEHHFLQADSYHVKTVGVPLEAGLIFSPFKHVGLGLKTFANINKEAPFAGVAVTLDLGTLRA